MASDVDVSALASPVSEDVPCGEDLEYDPAFMELIQAAEGSDEVAVGDSVLEAEEPDWRDVRQRAQGLLERTRDLRVAMHLTMAELKLRGLPGFCDGLTLLTQFIAQLWDGVHPRLDPDDGNDPTMRLNAIEGLRSEGGFLPALRAAPVCAQGPARTFTFRELLAVRGLLEGVTLGEDHDRVRSELDRALAAGDLAPLQASVDAIAQSLNLVRQIDGELMERVGSAAALDWSPLSSLLESMQKALNPYITQQGGVQPGSAEAAALDDEADGASSPAPPAEQAVGGAAGAAGVGQGLPRSINSREDVVRAMQLICDYYERHEPASPVPLLVSRAKRLASMSFVEIVREMAPEGMQQVRLIGGMRDEADEDHEET